jgi:hypothetical protein
MTFPIRLTDLGFLVATFEVEVAPALQYSMKLNYVPAPRQQHDLISRLHICTAFSAILMLRIQRFPLTTRCFHLGIQGILPEWSISRPWFVGWKVFQD